jgi:hypothetical protein
MALLEIGSGLSIFVAFVSAQTGFFHCRIMRRVLARRKPPGTADAPRSAYPIAAAYGGNTWLPLAASVSALRAHNSPHVHTWPDGGKLKCEKLRQQC